METLFNLSGLVFLVAFITCSVVMVLDMTNRISVFKVLDIMKWCYPILFLSGMVTLRLYFLYLWRLCDE